MRIVIDARKIGDFGIGEYIKQILMNFSHYPYNDDYYLIIQKEKDFPLELGSNFYLIPTEIKPYSVKEVFFLGLLINKLKPDIVHFPHFTVPIFIKARVITTIHDLIYLKYIDLFYTPLHKFYLLPVMNYAVKRSDALITVSQKAGEDIKKHYHIHDKKLNIIHNGLNSFRSLKTDIKESLGIRNPYFLFTGNLKFHKNLINIIKAFSVFTEKIDQDIDLVLAGIGRNNSFEAFMDYISRYIDTKRVIPTGFLSNAELGELYENALGLLIVSLCEGFGLPALEAMNFDIPVIASKDSPMAEFLRENGIYVNPFSIKEIESAMSFVFYNNERLKGNMNNKETLKEFQWSISAEKTYDIYRKVYEKES